MSIDSVHPKWGNQGNPNSIFIVGWDFGTSENKGVVVLRSMRKEYALATDKLPQWGHSLIEATLPSMARGDYDVIVKARGLDATAPDKFTSIPYYGSPAAR